MTNVVDTEILIIGGGIAGTSIAYHLAQQSYEVTLLERLEIAAEASGANAGTIWPTGWGEVSDLQSTLTVGSLEIFKSLQLELGYNLEFRQSGALRVIQTEEQYKLLSNVVLDLKARGHCIEFLTTKESRSIEPELSPEILGCGYYPLGASVHPGKATRAFASAAQQKGARILTGYEVTAIKYLGDKTYWIDTPHGAFHAGLLVLAAGPWCRPIGLMLGLDIPVTPVRAQMWSTERLPPRLFHVIGSAESTLDWHKDPGGDNESPSKLTHRGDVRLTRHLYGRQTRDGEIIIGGDRQLSSTKVPDPTGIEVNREHALEILPFMRELPIKRTWAGWMAFTPNLEPIIGKIPQLENLYVLTGVYASGFERGPMAGKVLADYIHSRESLHILSKADPARQVTLIA
jgi:sarcosine oxidase subunit beta